MKRIFTAITITVLAFASTEASEPINGTFVAVFSEGDGEPIPGSIAFGRKGARTIMVAHFGGERYEVPVTMRPMQKHTNSNPPIQYVDDPSKRTFDGVVSAEDMLWSVTVTGRIFDLQEGLGDGMMAIHTAQKTRAPRGIGSIRGGIKLVRFKLAKLNAEQGGAGQPATAPESKPEGENKTKPGSEGRSQ